MTGETRDPGRWGKAGVRLTDGQLAARRADAVRSKARHDFILRKNLELAHTKWRMGLMVPHNITSALNCHDLYGPDVDTACGAAEPDVDLWEAGKLYPSWDQACLLAELTMRQPVWFMAPRMSLTVWETSMRFHWPNRFERDPIPVSVFTPAALAAAVARWGIDPAAVP